MPTKNQKRVRSYGENDIYYKLPAGSYTSVGLVNKGYVNPVDETTFDKIPLAGKIIVTVDSNREVGFEGELAQTGKDEMALIDLLNGKTGEFAVFDGVVDNKETYYYYKEVEFMLVSRKTEGQLQVIQFKVNAIKQSANVSVADTGLPSGWSIPAGTYTGTNGYYCIIEKDAT